MPPVTIRKPLVDPKLTDTGGSIPQTLSPLTAQQTVLVGCGEAMRRTRHTSSARPEETERALLALSPSAVASALSGMDTVSTRSELSRAIEDAFEAAFAEDEEERTMFASSAMSGLVARDQFASALFAAKARMSQLQRSRSASDGSVVAPERASSSVDSRGAHGEAALAEAIATAEGLAQALDRQMSHGSRSLTGVNRERRAELDRLDPEQRSHAWWYADRATEGDDDLLVALGDLNGKAVSKLGPAAEADRAASELPWSDASLEASALRRECLGAAGDSERQWLAHRAQKSAPLQEALAIAEDRSVEDADAPRS